MPENCPDIGEFSLQALTEIGTLSEKFTSFYNKGYFKEAIPVAIGLRDVIGRCFGKDSFFYANSLNNLAQLYQFIGDYSEAEFNFRQALEISRKTLGENHPTVAAVLNNLGMLYVDRCIFVEAESLLMQALEIRRKVLGENHSDVAQSLHNLGGLYRIIGKFGAAEQLLQQALEIRRRCVGQQHPLYAKILVNLALLYINMGKYQAAKPLLLQALAICREVLGENHPDNASLLNHLGEINRAAGEYEAAKQIFQEALEIRRKILSENHPDLAQSLNSLGQVFWETGHYKAAEQLFQEALKIRRKALGENHPDLAQSLNNLGIALLDMVKIMGSPTIVADSITSIESLLRQALKIRRKTLGEDHPDVAQSLNNLATFYQEIGNYREAEPLYRLALEIRQKCLGETHPDVAASLHNLADLYSLMGKNQAAEPLARQAHEIVRKTLGEHHPYVARHLESIALICTATSRQDEALAHMKQAMAIKNRLIGHVFAFASEAHRMAFLTTSSWNFHAFLSLVARYFPSDHAAIVEALNQVLRRKALGAEALAVQRDAVLGGRYPQLQPRLRELTALRLQIAQKTLAGPGDGDPEAYRRLLAEWTAQRERLEADLARQIPEMNLEQRLQAADRQAVAKALPKDTALVEFVRFNVYDFQAVPAQGEQRWKEARYLAFVLPAGEPDRVQMLDLGEAAFIDRRIARFRAAMTGESEPRRDLGALPTTTPRDDGAGIELRQTVFDPLLPVLGDRQQLLLSPDGDLTRLPFEVLPTDDGQRLIDRYRLSYVAAGRDVLRFGVSPTGTPAAPLIAADPDFDLGGGMAQPQAASGRRSRDLDRAHLRFTALPGTRAEGQHLAQLLQVQPWLAGAALEANLKAQRSPRILHLATHGFFLEDQRTDLEKALYRLGFSSGADPQTHLGSHLESPLLRSGLALAGANTWLQGQPCPPEAEDGLLTAEDVTGLDLLDTELVVLSACETGLGDVQIGEGVLGLRRSFVLAGAKTLVMSLWKVPDAQTQELMEDFYTRLLAGQPRAEALRAAQLTMKARHPEPLYWGAFICQGEIGPLRQS